MGASPLFLAASPVLRAFEASDPLGQGIVLLLLLVAVYVWILLAEKAFVTRRVRVETAAFVARFPADAAPLEPLLQADRLTGPLAAMYRAGTAALFDLLKLDRNDMEFCCRQRLLPRALTPAELEAVRVSMERVRAEQAAALEHHLPLLDILIKVSPLLGLLGTAWQLMLAFGAFAGGSHVTLDAVVPAVSAALLPTVVGLFLAAPALIVQRVLAAEVQQTGQSLQAFIPEFLSRLRLAAPAA